VLFVFGPRFCAVCKRHGYITAADFARGRFDSSSLALAVAFTGILATMPYIGLKTVIAAMGISGDWPIIIAFVVLAAYTYQSGLRAPALTAIVKDLATYITVLVAIIYILIKLVVLAISSTPRARHCPSERHPRRWCRESPPGIRRTRRWRSVRRSRCFSTRTHSPAR
jgi:Na+/proline symporter